MKALRVLAVALVVEFCLAGAAAAEPSFETVALAAPGRTVAVEWSDFDGDGRGDLMRVGYAGVPPHNDRAIHFHFQRADGGFDPEPSLTLPLSGGEALYDLVGVGPARLLLLDRDGVSVVSVAERRIARLALPSPAAPTVAAAADHRGLERTRLAWSDGRGGHWLALAGFGETAVVAMNGETVARIPVEGRADYSVRRATEPVYTESDAQVVFDAPRLAAGDVDGDGLVDLVVATRSELRVHLQSQAGAFSSDADARLELPVVAEDEHYREAVLRRSDFADVDADGRLDLLVSTFRGVVSDGRVETAVYLNRAGSWRLESPDAQFTADGHFGGDGLIDVDGDGRLELVRVTFPVGLLEMVEALLTRELDAKIHVHRIGEEGRAASPVSVKLGIPFSLQTQEAIGFSPTLAHDVDGDGYRDLLTPGDGTRLEVRRGGAQSRYETVDLRHEVDTRGRLRVADADGDGLSELILYDPTRADSPVLLLRQRAMAKPGAARAGDRTQNPEHRETQP